MQARVTAFVRCLGALLLLLGCTWAVEIPAIAFLWRGQSLAPYAFFPNQSWDFLAKLRWFGDAAFSWAPALPDRFVAPGFTVKVDALLALLPATLACALAVGAALGILTALRPARGDELRRAVVAWAAFALVVHLGASLPALGLDEGLRVSRLAFRARSLVIDGMLLATAVSLVSALLAWMLAPLFQRSRAAALAGVLAMLALAVAAPPAGPAVVPASQAKPAANPSQPRPNIVLISLDSLRADHIGAYGYRRDTTPNFDRFAAQGALFRNMVSTSSWTLPTHLTMFTGRSQLAHGVVVDTSVLSSAVPTLGEILHDAGYATAGFVTGPYVGGQYGYARGMDTYVDLSAEFGGKGAEARGAVLSPKLNEMGLAWLDQPRDRPFFLFLHYFDIHYDYVPPAPYDRMFDPDYTGTMDGRRFIERPDVNAKMPARDLEHIRALYDGEIRFVDEHVGKVLARLDEKGLGDSTVVLIVADHGEEFFEHGNKGHHRALYDEVLHIPLAIRLPRGEIVGRQVPGQASLLDIFPTILDAAGIAAPPEAEGESLLGWLRGATSTREAVFSDFYDKRGFNLQVSRRTPTNKTIEHFNRITHPKQGGVEHYDLAADPGEKTDLAPSRPEAMVSSLDRLNEWLDARWQAHRSVEAAGGSSASLTMDAETMQKLKSLGYVGN